ncbi:MAG: hypothetical protein MN733_12750, partial [Nitrososphaera sp.]|nr:hypothetical protein [Nitrososphaera sp.]
WFPSIPNLQPRFILYYVGLNDFDKDEGYTYDELLIEQNSLRQQLRERSALYYVLRTLKGMYLARYVNKTAHGADKTTDWTDVSLIRNYDGLMSDWLASYAARLRVLIDKTRLFGAVPIFMTQPSRRFKFVNGEITGHARIGTYNGMEFNGVDYFHMMKRINAVTMKTCLEHGGICVDLAKELQLDDADFYDGSHMTSSGTKKVGLYLYSKLANYLG